MLRRLGDVEQVSRVVGTFLASGEHEVVACPLAFGAHPAGREPDDRVEPVRRAQHLRQRLRQAVAPFDVRELVE